MRRAASYSPVDLMLRPIADATSIVERSFANTDSLAEQEPWHFVGTEGEPAYENGWSNVEISGKAAVNTPRTMFRVLETGVGYLELFAGHDAQSAIPAGSVIFTLPEDARPADRVAVRTLGTFATTAGGLHSRAIVGEPLDVLIDPNGQVSLRQATTGGRPSGTRVLLKAAGTTGRWYVREAGAA